MRQNRIQTIIAIFALISVGTIATVFTNKGANLSSSIYTEPLAAAPVISDPLTGIHENWLVDESFETHLPILIIDSGGERPPINTADDGTGTMRPIPGLEPYRSGSIKLIDTGAMNRITDSPKQESLMEIKRRGNSSMTYEKAQYLVKLMTESGQDRYVDFFGMGAEREWVINGSLMDKSMMRNYLAYRIGNDVMPYTPESIFTEVIYHENGQYYYEGVHLLMENIKQGEERVAIEAAANSDYFPPYILRRDRDDDEDIILDTWATQNQLTTRFLGVIYPGQRNITQEDIDYITNDVNNIEQILFSDDPDIFSTYPRYIDVPSFIDYFLINEFFTNYDAGVHSTYMYKDKGQKLKMGPIWDYDGAMDNYKTEPLEYEVTAFQTHPWFDRLMTDEKFIDQMQKRYAELRRGPFSDENFITTVDMVTNHLGSAIDREWTRWGHIYTGFNRHSLQNFESDTSLVRNATEHRVEMYRLKTAILKHAGATGSHLDKLQRTTTMNTGVNYYMPLILLAAVLIFAIPAYYASRK